MLRVGISIKGRHQAMVGVVALVIVAGVIFISCGGESGESTAVSDPTIGPTATFTPIPTSFPTPTPAPTPTPEPTPTASPVPRATPESGTITQEQKEEFLEGLDAALIVEDIIAVIEENPIFRAARTQLLLDGGTEIFDAVFEYTGDPDAPLKAQGTHTTPSIDRIYEYDSTWHSTCVRKIAPSSESWRYYEHDGWWRNEDSLGTLVVSIPFYALLIDSLFADMLSPYEVEWETFDLFRRSGVLEFVLRPVIFDVIDDTKVVLDISGYTIHIHPREHPHRVVFERSYLFGQLSSDTTYFYDIEEGPAVHESREDCLSRNSG